MEEAYIDGGKGGGIKIKRLLFYKILHKKRVVFTHQRSKSQKSCRLIHAAIKKVVNCNV